MQIDLPSGTRWHVREAAAKLKHRAGLPGARVFDLATASLRRARHIGLAPVDRFTLALASSWLVNSPALSRVLRRWALPPHRDTGLALLDVLEGDPVERCNAETAEAMTLAVRSLGDEPYVVEALSKIFALLAPDAVPLMPAAARTFVLGPGTHDTPDAFGMMVRWFTGVVTAHETELGEMARAHTDVELSGPQALDRLLWFDSEGHAHFPKIPA